MKRVEQRVEEGIEIVENTATRGLLAKYGAPEALINAVDSKDRTEFPKLFVEYYRNKYESEAIKADIAQVRFMRDKAVAHNETTEYVRLEFETVYRLLRFATEIVSVFGMAYHSSIWETDKISMISKSAERNAWFVKSAILKLKES